MGSGRDKRKKAKGKVPGHGEEKTARKTELNQTKAERRTAKKIEVFLRFFGVCFCAHMESMERKPRPCSTKSHPQNAFCILSDNGMQGGEDDIDALLKQFELKDKKAKEIVVLSNADPPSARLFASFTPVPGAVKRIHPVQTFLHVGPHDYVIPV